MPEIQRRAPISVILKLERATKHFNSLKREVDEFFNANPDDSIFNFEADVDEMVVRVRVIKPPPDEWGTIIGDCIYNLRSALDHLISITSMKHGGSMDRTEFPIFIDREVYFEVNRSGKPTGRSGLAKITDLPIKAQALLESLQPYNRTNGPPDLHPLWLLHEISNHAKHREIDMTHASISTGYVDVTGLGHTIGESRFSLPVGALEDGTVVVKMHRMLGRTVEPQVNVNFKFTPGVTFSPEGPGRGLPILGALMGINNFINREIIPPFSEFVLE